MALKLSMQLDHLGWDIYLGWDCDFQELAEISRYAPYAEVMPYIPNLPAWRYAQTLNEMGVEYVITLAYKSKVSRRWKKIIGGVADISFSLSLDGVERYPRVHVEEEQESFFACTAISATGGVTPSTMRSFERLYGCELTEAELTWLSTAVTSIFEAADEVKAPWTERKLSFQRSLFRENSKRTLNLVAESAIGLDVLYLCMNASFGEAATPGTYGLISEVAKVRNVLVLCPPPSDNIVFTNEEIDIEYIDVNDYKRDISMLSEDAAKLIRDPILGMQPKIVHIIGIKGAGLIPKIREWGYSGRIILDIRTPTISADTDELNRHARRLLMAQYYTDAFAFGSVGAKRREMPFSFKPTSIISPGILLDQFEPKDAVSDSINKFIYVGNIAKSRQIEQLVNQFEYHVLAGSGNDTLDLYGGGNDLDKLRTVVKRKGLERNVRFLGRVEQSELNRKMSEYDAGVAFVPDLEHFGVSPSLKAMEYIAAGIPVFASDTRGHRDFMTETGAQVFLFAPDVDGFSKAVAESRNYSYPDDYFSAQEKVAYQLSYQSIVKNKVLPLYEGLLERCGNDSI